MQKFYFTYATDCHPFCGGWTEITAPDMDTACKLFRVMHPDKTEGLLNCAAVYTEEEFSKTEMSRAGHNFNAACYERISVELSDMSDEAKLPGVMHLEALALLHKAVDAGVLTAAGNDRVYVMFGKSNGDSYWLPVTFDEAADSLVRNNAMGELRKGIEAAEAGKEREKEMGFTYADALADVIDYLKAQDEDYFTSRGQTKEAVLRDRNLLSDCASEHLHCVTRFGNDREWSCKDACDNEPGIGGVRA